MNFLHETASVFKNWSIMFRKKLHFMEKSLISNKRRKTNEVFYVFKKVILLKKWNWYGLSSFLDFCVCYQTESRNYFLRAYDGQPEPQTWKSRPMQSKIVRASQTMIRNLPISISGMVKDQLRLLLLKTRKYSSAGAKQENSITGQFIAGIFSLAVQLWALNHR